MTAASKKTLVVRNGTLIDGSGRPAARNGAIAAEILSDPGRASGSLY